MIPEVADERTLEHFGDICEPNFKVLGPVLSIRV